MGNANIRDYRDDEANNFCRGKNYHDLSLFVNADTFHFKRVCAYINQTQLRLYRAPLIIFHP